MTLLVDLGNTSLKWARWRGSALTDYQSQPHAGGELAAMLEESWRELPRPNRVVVANVAGEQAGAVLARFSHAHYGIAPEFVLATARACGVSNGYAEPARLGIDRWAASIAAYRLQGGPVCVVGCGTALTVDTVTHDGRHLGGMIAPGLALMRRALAMAAPALAVAPAERLEIHARDTATAIGSGTLYAAAGFIDSMLTRIAADQGEGLKIVLCGGDAERLQAHLSRRYPYIVAPPLVLEGLAFLAGERE